MDHLADGLVYYIAFLFSTTVHEAAHACVHPVFWTVMNVLYPV